MSGTRTFKSYNFITGAVDGTLAYDFGSPRYYEPEEETVVRPQLDEREWIREDGAEAEAERADARARSRTMAVSPFSLLGAAGAVIILIMVLLAQIQLVGISNTAAQMERQIAELEDVRDKLTVEYETVFNLKDVEEYAVGVLGMQAPREDQVYYLTNVTSADRAVIISRDTGALSLGLEDVMASLKAYFD